MPTVSMESDIVIVLTLGHLLATYSLVHSSVLNFLITTMRIAELSCLSPPLFNL